MLYPFWGEARTDPDSPTAGRFDGYIERGPSLFSVVDDLAGCDAALLPAAWEHVRDDPVGRARAERLAEETQSAERELLIFYVSDDADEVPLRATVYRSSLYRSRLRPREQAMPALSVDVLRGDAVGEVTERPYRDRPVVGFCGYAPGLSNAPVVRAASQRARATARIAAGRAHPDTGIRARALRRLTRSPHVETNFVIRDAFWGGVVAVGSDTDYATMRRVRDEFVINLLESDYVLCARGGGNFSYRLYETMSAGRIPVFVDTDCVLPFESELDWHSLCVWVDRSELDEIGDRVASFHAALGPSGFAELQRECRRVWEHHLSTEGFFSTLSRHLATSS
jgi:hypothetical protein